MTHYFEFCNDWGSGIYPGPSEYMKKYLVAANGDVLHLMSNDGIVLDGRTDEHPDDVVEYWRTPISVLGGTGRFEGAKGDLISDDYVTADEQTHHRFYGKITLGKGKRK